MPASGKITRRDMAIYTVLAACSVTSTASFADTPTSDPLPDPSKFESGDFVWPKKRGVYIPYKSGSRNDPNEDERKWIAERDKFVSEASKAAPDLRGPDLEYLRTLSFPEFYARYVGDQVPGTPGVYESKGGIYVGHVAILEKGSAGQTWVIEAIDGSGVIRHTYEDWLSGRPDEIVWHGRVRNRTSAERAKIASAAKKYLDIEYDFWNFNLADARGFYCSKLAWLSIRDALDFAIDGNDNPRRWFWFSPKQLLYLETIERLNEPEVEYKKRAAGNQ